MPEDIFENEVEVAADIPQQAEVRQYTSSVTIGDVTTLPAGSQATVTNTGTESNAILNFGLPKGDSGSMWGELAGNIEDQTDLNTLLTGLRTDVDAKAALVSPALTGTPTAPTAVDDTNTTQIATTAFVKNAITNLNNTLQTYVQTYVNTAVANVLKTMDWANKVDVSLVGANKSYTIPSDGYLIFSADPNAPYYVTLDNKSLAALVSNNQYSYVTRGTVISVVSGTVLRTVTAAAQVYAAFVPVKS